MTDKLPPAVGVGSDVMEAFLPGARSSPRPHDLCQSAAVRVREGRVWKYNMDFVLRVCCTGTQLSIANIPSTQSQTSWLLGNTGCTQEM